MNFNGTDLVDYISDDAVFNLQFVDQFKFKINRARYYELEETWLEKGRVVNDSMIYFFLSGKTHLTLKDQTQVCKRGALAFMPEDFSQSWHVSSENQNEVIKLVVLHLDPYNAFSTNLFKLFETLFVQIEEVSYWENRLLEFISVFNKNRLLGESIGNDMLRELMAYLIVRKFSINIKDIKIDKRVQRILEFIHEKYNESIGVEEISEMVELSSVQVRKIFNKEIGTNPKEYIYMYRLNQSVKLLKFSNLSIKEIAFKIGFKNDHYYHFLFKKQFGMTPSEFREKEISIENI